MNKTYITTTLPYTNAKPHIGHTLEFVQADVLVRYLRKKMGGENVWFNVGADEHGLKMYQKAQELGISAQDYVDKLSNDWKEFCNLFQISYDTFYRTSDPSHHKKAQEWWKKADSNGDIYKKTYTGLYCVGCESFKTEKELVDGKCPDHGVEPITISEENYFFKLSKYRNELLEWLEQNPTVLKPDHKVAEIKNWISNMEDISISRVKEKLPWGIEVPNDPTQVMYVWFDALTDYINVLDQPEAFQVESFNKDKGVEKWWPGIQFFGPDNLRFQAGIWQGMLASFGLPQTKKLLNHGMILASDGTKMSKSKGNGVDPFEQLQKYNLEALRLYLIAGITTFSDSPYKEDELVNLYNDRLANNFGNLLNRVIHLANAKEIKLNFIADEEITKFVESKITEVNNAFEEFELQKAVNIINELADYGNEYITQKAPWSKEISTDQRTTVLNNLSYLILKVADLYECVIPDSAKKAKEMLKNQQTGVLFEKIG